MVFVVLSLYPHYTTQNACCFDCCATGFRTSERKVDNSSLKTEKKSECFAAEIWWLQAESIHCRRVMDREWWCSSLAEPAEGGSAHLKRVPLL